MKTARNLCAMILGAAMLLPAGARAAVVTHSFNLDGGQEVPANASDGVGSMELTIDDVAGTVSFFLVALNLDGEMVGAHIHLGAAGTEGNVVFDLGDQSDFDGLLNIGGFDVPNSLVLRGTNKAIDLTLAAAINASPWQYYANLHTTAFTGGEIRGQLEVAAVPVPAALWLMPGAIGLLLRQRRRA